MDFEKAYKLLFNAITDGITELGKSKVIAMELDSCLEILKRAKQETEEMYIQSIQTEDKSNTLQNLSVG